MSDSLDNIQHIPFFDYPSLYKENEEKIKAKLNEVLYEGSYILQKEVQDLEKDIQDFLGVKHAITVANGTDGLLLVLRAANIRPKDEVILPSHTYIASAASIYFNGGIPVFAECSSNHMMDVEHVKKLTNENTKFIMPVHINGRCCQMDEIVKLAEKNNITIIEDAAQALGAKFNNKYAGTFGLAGMFSFYPAKVLGCFGDGGCVVTNCSKTAEKLYLLRNHGRDENGNIIAWGFNSRLDNIQAGVLGVKFSNYEKAIERRRSIASLYNEKLSDVEELNLPPAPDSNPLYFDIYQNYEIQAKNRDHLRNYLKESGIGTIIQWNGKAVHMIKELGFNNVRLPITEEMTSKFVLLPMNTFITDGQVNYICEKIKSFYARRSH